MKLSPHFADTEFFCSCCGKSIKMSNILIERLEKLHDMLNAKAIIVTSGYRCEKNPYGRPTDAHRKGLAGDIKVQKQNGTFYKCEEIAEAAERIGFGGIGLMPPDACHVDTRDCETYTVNGVIVRKWFGCEYSSGSYVKSDTIKTFQKGTIFPERTSGNTKRLFVSYEGKTLLDIKI